jgi:beta-lactamase superfamily II metal-dependent hydrolase
MEGEAQIIQFNETLKSDVLKVGHHGSKIWEVHWK